MSPIARKVSRKQKNDKRAADRAYRKEKRATFLKIGIKSRTFYLDDAEYVRTREFHRREGIEGSSAIAKLNQLALAETRMPPTAASENIAENVGGQLLFPEINASK